MRKAVHDGNGNAESSGPALFIGLRLGDVDVRVRRE